MTAAEVQAQRDARVLAFIAKKTPTRAEILEELSTRCGGRRGVDTTIGRLLAKKAIVLTHATVERPEIGRKVGTYTLAKDGP